MSTERIEHPFSNGTEGMDWQQAWCGECIHDHGFHNGGDQDGCPLFVAALIGNTPLVWQPYEKDWWRMLPAGIVCRAFEQCTPCGEPERRGGQTFREALGLTMPHTAPTLSLEGHK